MFAGPYLALFANLTDLETSLHVLDRVVLSNLNAVQSIIQNVLVQMKPKILSLREEKLHPYLVKQMYVQAVNEEKFFPSI